MKLSIEQIRSIAKGVDRVVPNEGKISLIRFTEAQQKMYFCANKDFYNKTFATAGVSLDFTTSSSTLTLKVDVSVASSRTFFFHDIFINGEQKHALGADLADSPDKHMTLEGSFALGDGEKRITIYFPWSVRSEIIGLELDDGATLSPVAGTRKILMFGDSITHGYDASHPTYSYSSILCRALDADGCNKGIGGEIFRPELSALADNYTPDIITVAYGTNDWSKEQRESFDRKCAEFYKNLSELYPNAKIFALAPIWRGDYQAPRSMGELSHIAERLSEVAASLLNVTFIDCFDFVPHLTDMFSPDILHPNDEGFEKYAESLISEIKKHI